MSNGPAGSREDKVTKLAAARRQLHTAIRLFFEDGDILSVHTLSMAAHAILRTLITAMGGGSHIKDSDYIKPEHRSEFNQVLNYPSNFLKHADRDPEEVLSFNDWFPIPFLLDNCLMYQRVTGKISRECIAFIMWFSVQYPQYLAPEMAKVVQGLIDAGMISASTVTKEMCLDVIKKPVMFPLPKTGAYEND